jgi:hypothetical protein
VPAFIVIDRILVERLADALGQRAMHLALDDQRVDDTAEVVGAGEVDKLDRAGLAIDFDLGDVGTSGIGEVDGIVENGLV